MSRFRNKLNLQLMIDDETGKLLANKSGRQLYQVLADFSYESDVIGTTVTVPAGFVTDLASVPRLWIVYAELGDMAQMPGTVHDFLYSKVVVPRKTADQVLREAMLLTGLPHWKAEAFYLGVRIGGGSHYGP